MKEILFRVMFIVVFIIILNMLLSCTAIKNRQEDSPSGQLTPDQNNNETVVGTIEESVEGSFEGSLDEKFEGQVCYPYVPKGQFLYESEWTGAFPEIEKFDGVYSTATFGLG